MTEINEYELNCQFHVGSVLNTELQKAYFSQADNENKLVMFHAAHAITDTKQHLARCHIVSNQP